MLEIGSVVDNKYKILHEIGKGGMSRVYLAINESSNKEWAIKEIKKKAVTKDGEAWHKPLTEAALMKNLRHEHLPVIADVLENDDYIMIVMDYIEGRTLKQILAEDGAQKQEDVINWSIQLCGVLSYLHKRKPPIIYRDMKPGNVMLKPDGNVMLIDFGAAREFKDGASGDTSCLGTKGYAAPEQYGGGGQTDERTDIYNMGATMYHLVTGKDPTRPPYEMRPIREWDRSLSTGLEEIIRYCTKNDPDERYQTADDLLYALNHYREMEHGYRKKKEGQWKRFLAASAVSVICMIGAAAAAVTGEAAKRKAYRELIRVGQTESTDNLKTDAYIKAIKTNPTKEEAYEKLLNDVMLSDGYFSTYEANTITDVLDYRKTVRGKNRGKSIKQKFYANRKGYEKFYYDMGVAYFFYYKGNGSKELSRQWFQVVTNGNRLGKGLRNRAELCCRIADYYEGLGKEEKSGDVTVTFMDYWNDLLMLIRGGKEEGDGLRTALAMDRDLTLQICTHASDFKASGVGEKEMRSQLKRIEQEIRENEESMDECSWILAGQIEENIQTARDAIDTAFSE